MQTSLTALEINTNEGVVSEVLLKEINGEFPQLRDLHNSLADADKRMEELCLTITEKQSVLSREKSVPSRLTQFLNMESGTVMLSLATGLIVITALTTVAGVKDTFNFYLAAVTIIRLF